MQKVHILTVGDGVDADAVISAALERGDRNAVRIWHCTGTADFYRALAQVQRGGQQPALTFLLKTQSGPKLLPLSSITYCTADGHRLQVNLVGDGHLTGITSRLPFCEQVDPLLEQGFLLVRRGMVVNPQHVCAVQCGTLRLTGGVSLSIPRRLRTSVLEDLLRQSTTPRPGDGAT